jgi:hypothetical protein
MRNENYLFLLFVLIVFLFRESEKKKRVLKIRVTKEPIKGVLFSRNNFFFFNVLA